MAGYLRASSLPARADSSPSSTLARAWIAGAVGLPSAVEGANSTPGLLRIRLSFHAVSQVRKDARAPSTTMLTAVPTRVPPRLYVVSKTAHCLTKGSRISVESFIARLPPHSSADTSPCGLSCAGLTGRHHLVEQVFPPDRSVSPILAHQCAFAERARRLARHGNLEDPLAASLDS